MVRRLTRTSDVAWPRWRLYLPLAVAATTAVSAACWLVSITPPGDPLLATFYPPTMMLLVAFVAGAAVLVMEGTRDRSGRTARALYSLPLTSRHVTALARLPSLVLAPLALIVPLAPAVAALRSVGIVWGTALLIVFVAAGAGLVTMAVPYIACSLILRSRRWDPVRFPVVFLIWGACYATQVFAAVRDIGASTPDASLWLPLARVFREVLAGGVGGDTALLVLIAAVVAAAGIGWMFLSVETGRDVSEIRWEWRGRGFPGRVLGELRYSFRDVSVRANALLSILMSCLLAGAYLALPGGAKAQFEPMIIAVVGVFAAVTPRTVRGLVPSHNPPQRLIGVSPASWSLSTSLVVIVFCWALMTPGIVVVVASGGAGGAALVLAGTACLSAALAIMLGSALPVAAGNVFGQGVVGGLTVLGVVALSSAFRPVFERAPAVAALAAAVLLVVAGGIAALVEVARFTNHLHEEKERN